MCAGCACLDSRFVYDPLDLQSIGYLIADYLVLGHLLTKKQIIPILKQYNVPHKACDKKEVIVNIYERFIKSQAQVKRPPTSTALLSTTRIEPSPAQVIPKGTIGSPPCEYSNLLDEGL